MSDVLFEAVSEAWYASTMMKGHKRSCAHEMRQDAHKAKRDEKWRSFR